MKNLSRNAFFEKALALAICCFLSACVTLPFGNRPAPPSSPVVEQAREAWAAGNMEKVKRYYSSALKTTTITQAEKCEAYERTAIAYARTGMPNKSLEYLDIWVKMDPKAREQAGWQNAWFAYVSSLSRNKAISTAKKVWQDGKMPGGLRMCASIYLFGNAYSAAQILQNAPQLYQIYAQAENTQRANWERQLLTSIKELPFSVLNEVIDKIISAKTVTFPYSVLTLEQARRIAKSDPAKSSQLLTRIRTAFADKSIIENAMNDQSKEAACVVLALPMNGAFTSVSANVNAGARVAQQELAGKGARVQLEVINTAQPDWLTKLSSLPEQCTIVGGPLQTTAYRQLKSSGQIQRHAVFAFMPQLDSGDEGTSAWRFFQSPDDQAQAVAKFARNELALSSFATFHPADTYGSNMADLFAKHITQLGGTVNSAAYDPATASGWTESAGKIMQDENGISRQPEAIFLPDSWKKIELLTSAISYYGPNRSVLLGTSLWEQGIGTRFLPQSEKYALAAFPAPWNPAKIPAALSSSGKADFWKCLGYDFVHFAAQLKIDGPTSPSNINAKLSNTHISWAMAPIRWDNTGIAHQDLLMFTTSSRGMTLLNTDSFKLLRTAEPQSSQEQQHEAAQDIPGMPKQNGGEAPLLSGPRSSHKLQLPNR